MTTMMDGTSLKLFYSFNFSNPNSVSRRPLSLRFGTPRPSSLSVSASASSIIIGNSKKTSLGNQCSYAGVPSRSLTWNKRIKFNNRMASFHRVSRPDRFTDLHNPLRLEAPRTSRGRCLRISSFKGNAQNNELGDKLSKSSIPKNSVGIFNVPQDTNPTKLQDVSISCASQSNGVTPRSQAIHKLFRHWVALLWADSQTQIGQEILESPAKDVQPQKGSYLKERGEVLKVVYKYFMGLDAPVKIPMLIFAPLYLAVNLVHGPRVARELTPLWIIGPLVAALYVKLIQGLIALYIISFKVAVQAWKDFPTYYDTVCKYIADGKYKHVWFLQPSKTSNESESIKRRQAYEDWSEDVLGWFSQLFWPVQYRIVKVLKRAKLI